MLLTLKEGDAIGYTFTTSFCLCHVLHVFYVIIKYGVLCPSFIYNYSMYRWHGGIYVSMYTVG